MGGRGGRGWNRGGVDGVRVGGLKVGVVAGCFFGGGPSCPFLSNFFSDSFSISFSISFFFSTLTVRRRSDVAGVCARGWRREMKGVCRAIKTLTKERQGFSHSASVMLRKTKNRVSI